MENKLYFCTNNQHSNVKVKCTLCNWKGEETELKSKLFGKGEYESREICCPNCFMEHGIIKI